MKTILGSGQLGLALLDALLKNNPDEAILLVNRSGKIAASLPANVSVAAANVTDATELTNIARQSSVMFSCTDVPYQQWSGFYPAAAQALAQAIDATQTKLVFADNLYSYGNVKGQEMHEAMPHAAQTRKGRIRSAVLQTLLYEDPARAQRVAVVKSSDFIGPRIHKGVFGVDFLEKLFAGKTVSLFGNPALPHTFTGIDDFAQAMVQVGNANDAFAQVWHVPNAPALSLLEWLHLFEQETGRKAKTMVLHKSLVKMAGWFSPLIRELYELAYQYEYPYLLNHDKYAKRFGQHFTPAEAVVKTTVQWFKARPQ